MSSHDISHLNSSNGWPTPAASRFGKQRRLEAETPENPWPRSEAHAYALLLATFSICSVRWSKPCAYSQAVTSTHLAPSCCEAGVGQPFVLQRSFEHSSQ